MQRTELLIREVQVVYQTTQKVGYSYDFASKKILDPLTLSVALKQLGVLSADSIEQMSANLPEVAHKLQLLKDVQKTLNDSVTGKFQDAFNHRDYTGLVSCTQVFFNLEMLSD